MEKINPILVRDRQGSAEEILLDVDYASFNYSRTVNTERQISFTVYRLGDSLFSYSLLKNKNYVIYNGQYYYIEQVNPGTTDGMTTKEVTALHVYFSCRQIKIRTVKTGVKTYSANDLMHFAFDGNQLGFTWELIGSFPNIQIENLGNLTALDVINNYLIERQFAYVKADNRHIKIYDESHYKNQTGKALNYFGNTSDVKASFDTTSLANEVQCYGKQKDGKEGQYYVSFLYRDQTSINNYGVWPGDDMQDDRFTDEASMRAYVAKTLQVVPTVTLTSNYYGDDVADLGDTLFLNVSPLDFETEIFITAISGTPFTSEPLTLTYNNNPKTILDMTVQMNKSINNFKKMVSNTNWNINIGGGGGNQTYTWDEKDVASYYGK